MDLITSLKSPNYKNFDPTPIPYQKQVADDIFCNFDYSIGLHEILLSGSVGSAKSVLAAWCILKHMFRYPKSTGMLARRALPDLKQTIFKELMAMCECSLVRKNISKIHHSTAYFRLKNGSEVISRTWHDQLYTKVRSLKLSFAVFEEFIECQNKDKPFYMETKLRLNRQPHVPCNWIMGLTNPEDEAHWIYDHFELGLDEGTGEISDQRSIEKHVYYSTTDDNPFLPDAYKRQLEEDYDELMYQRMGRGRWISITKDGTIYYTYQKDRNFIDKSYKVDLSYPVHLSWDFNIGEGKPLSVACIQFVNRDSDIYMHIFNQVVIEGMRTEGSCDELAGRGLLDYPVRYIINGDATGRSRDTRNLKSDYDIIKNFMANYKQPSGKHLDFEVDVPLSNPAIKLRHNKMRAMFFNAAGKAKAFVYKDAPMADKAFRLTQLKKGGNYIEDDSKDFQHIGTACGYALIAKIRKNTSKPQGTVLL